jgi:hypothetical protein
MVKVPAVAQVTVAQVAVATMHNERNKLPTAPLLHSLPMAPSPLFTSYVHPVIFF